MGQWLQVARNDLRNPKRGKEVEKESRDGEEGEGKKKNL